MGAGTHIPLRALASAPLAAHSVQLAVGELHRVLGIERLAGLARLLFQGSRDTLAAAGELQVALVGEHDRLGAPARADHDRLGVSAVLAEALEQGGQLRARFAGCQHLVRFASHVNKGSTNVYTYAITPQTRTGRANHPRLLVMASAVGPGFRRSIP